MAEDDKIDPAPPVGGGDNEEPPPPFDPDLDLITYIEKGRRHP